MNVFLIVFSLLCHCLAAYAQLPSKNDIAFCSGKSLIDIEPEAGALGRGIACFPKLPGAVVSQPPVQDLGIAIGPILGELGVSDTVERQKIEVEFARHYSHVLERIGKCVVRNKIDRNGILTCGEDDSYWLNVATDRARRFDFTLREKYGDKAPSIMALLHGSGKKDLPASQFSDGMGEGYLRFKGNYLLSSLGVARLQCEFHRQVSDRCLIAVTDEVLSASAVQSAALPKTSQNSLESDMSKIDSNEIIKLQWRKTNTYYEFMHAKNGAKTSVAK